MAKKQYNFETKSEMIDKLRGYLKNPDDDNIRFKKRIKERLLHCPELLYALHNPDLENELFNEDGTINTEGDWDLYHGDEGNIRPALFVPFTQSTVLNYVCYTTNFDDLLKYNDKSKNMEITFTIFVNGKDLIDKPTGIQRHDLIASIIREYINWSNIFGPQCHLVKDKEGTTDNDYVMRTLVFEFTIPNSLAKTIKGQPTIINDKVRR